jgi:hypothetical protein
MAAIIKEFLRIVILPIAFIASSLCVYAAQPQAGLVEAESNTTPNTFFTDCQGYFAYEQNDNYYRWQFKPSEVPVVDEGPRAAPARWSSISWAPVTIYNNWPDKLNNVSIFPYLLPDGMGQPHKELSSFVKEWYQCACAIIYRASSIDSKIVGSGALVEENMVATARHNFESIPPSNLYIRFFKYLIQKAPDPMFLEIRESYLDVPVIKRYIPKSGLDAGYLQIPKLSEDTFFQYAKVLPLHKEMFNDSIPIGHYAMFHFAGGKPQISIGEIQSSLMGIGTPLHNVIALQAGPGASGAAIIRKTFNEVQGGGISIYRILKDDYVDRRILSFSQIEDSSLGWIDEISAPYRDNPNFYVVPTDALLESGYEFLHWLDEAHVNRRGPNGNKFKKPPYDVYKVQDPRHGTHHIIPIDNMVFLWEYFYNLDRDTIAGIEEQVKEEAVEFGKHHYNKKFNREVKFQELHHAEVERQYGRFHLLLNDLYPSFYDNHEHKTLNTKNGFAWSLWNLFHGWNGSYRVDDPVALAAELHSRDYSERNRPQGFPIGLWNSIITLNNTLQELIRFCARSHVRNRRLEDTLYNSLAGLRDTWISMRPKKRMSIHPFNPNEWVLVRGRRDGHELYMLKP